jgi:hypothetical protein
MVYRVWSARSIIRLCKCVVSLIFYNVRLDRHVIIETARSVGFWKGEFDDAEKDNFNS